MYLPLVDAFNYALDQLSSLKVPGLPEFQENRQIIFSDSATKCIRRGPLQGSFKPDIILVRPNICSKLDRDVAWRDLLSTLEVKHGGSGGVGSSRRNPRGSRANLRPKYDKGFEDIAECQMIKCMFIALSAVL